MKTSEQEADKLSNGKSSQSWSEGKTGNPYKEHGGFYHNTFWVTQPSATPRSSFKQSLDTCCLLGGKAAALNLNGAPPVISLCFWEGANRGELRRQWE